MLLSDKTEEFIQRLRESEALSSCRIVAAYPYAVKPTRLEHTVIAVSPGELEAESLSLGAEELTGSLKINATVYCPYGSDELYTVVAEVLKAQLCAYPSAVSVSEAAASDKLYALYINCGFTFYGELSLGGEENE